MPRRATTAARLFEESDRRGHVLGVKDIPQVLEIDGWRVPPAAVVDRVQWSVDPALYDAARDRSPRSPHTALRIADLERVVFRVSADCGHAEFYVHPGATVVVLVPGPDECEACDGTGTEPGAFGHPCPDCLGTGHAR